MRHELDIPPGAASSENAQELIRIWAGGGKLHCVLRIGAWEHNPKVEEDLAWGRVLADAVQHIANALSEVHGVSPSETRRRIKRFLDDELDDPTSGHTGRFSE